MHKHTTGIIFLSLFIFIFSGCGFILLPEFEVESIFYDESKIIVKFSESVDKLSIAKAVMLEEDDETIATSYEFLGDVVFIYPKNGIRPNYDYVLIITNEAEDIKACSLETNFVYSFSTRSERDRPYIVSITPANDTRIMTDFSGIEICFSESINRKTFEKSFSISPSFDHFVVYSDDDKKVAIMPKTSITANTEYVIKISTELEDLYRNALADEFKSVIYYKTDLTEPDFSVTLKSDGYEAEIDNLSTTDFIPSDIDIHIDFNKSMKISTASSYVSITPSVSYTVERDERDGMYMRFNLKNIKWGQKYVLRIDNGLSDIYGNLIKDAREYTLIFNNEKNRPVQFIEGYFQTAEWNNSSHSSDDYKLINDASNYSHLIMNATDFTTMNEKECNLYLVFDCSKDSSGIDLFSAMNSISIAETNSCCSIELRKMSVVLPENYETEFIDNLFTSNVDFLHSNICVLKLTLQFRNSTSEGLVTITLDDEIKDTLGNSMGAEKIFVLSK